MITKFKIFESSDIPRIGDYVKIDSSKFRELKGFFDTNIGKIVNINDKEKVLKSGYPYEVKFDKMLPKSSYDYEITNTMSFNIVEILTWSKNLKELKMKIQTDKYNL